jgi:hypothetical protein
MTATFKHFEQCPGVTNDNKLLLGDELSGKLRVGGIQLPSAGSFAKIYAKLSQKIHNSYSLLRTESGSVIVPNDLPNEEKRFLVRFLKAEVHDVVVYGSEGLRDLKDDEVTTPPKKNKKAQTITATAKRVTGKKRKL